MPPAKDPKSLLWEHQLKRQHKLLSERLDQIDTATTESQAAMERRFLDHRQATEATVKNLEAKFTSFGDQIQSMQEDLATANKEQQRLTQEFKEKLVGLTRTVETLQASNTASEETLQQAALSEKRCALLVSDLQKTVGGQASEYEVFKKRLERTNMLLDSRLQDLELYGSDLPVSRQNKPSIQGVAANTHTSTEGIAIPGHQPYHDVQCYGSNLPRSVRNKKIDVPAKNFKKLVETVEASSPSAAMSAVMPLQQARKETPMLNTKSSLPKPPVRHSPRRSRRIAGTTSSQLDPPAQTVVPSSSPTTRALGAGRKRDINGIIKLRVPTVIVPESPVQSRIISPFRDQDSGFGQRTPTQLLQKLQAVQEPLQQPRQALSPVKNTDVRLNAPEKENLPPTAAKVVEDVVENEYTKVHVDPRDPTRIKRRRQIPSRYNN